MRVDGQFIRPDKSGSASATSGAIGNEVLDSLRTGDSIKAQVLSSNADEVNLKLADGSTQTARNTTGMSLPRGEILEFVVTGKNGGQISIALADPKLLTGDGDNTAALQTLARAFGIEPSQQNLEILRRQLAAGVTPSRDRFLAVARALEQMPQSTPAQLTFLQANRIPLTQPNLQMFQAFLDNRNAIGDKLGQLRDILASLPDALATRSPQPSSVTSPPSAAGDAVPEHPQAADDQGRPMPVPKTDEALHPKADGVQSQKLPSIPNAPGQSAASGQTGTLTRQTVLQQSQLSGEPTSALRQQPPFFDAQGKPISPELLTQLLTDVRQEGLPQAQAQAHAAKAASAETILPTAQQTDTATIPPSQTPPNLNEAARLRPLGQPTQAADGQLPQTTQRLDTQGKAVAHPPELPQIFDAQGKPIPPERLTERLREWQTAEETGRTEASGKSSAEARVNLSAAELLEKVENLFREIDHARADRLPRDLDAARLMRELSEVMRQVTERAETMPEAQRQQVQQTLQDISQSARFMDQMGQFASFVQIPVTLNGEKTTADLYVFNDSKRKGKKIDPNNATIFLSLATAHLGRVETFVKVIGKNVECDFRLEGEDTVRLWQGHSGELLRMLAEEGYRLSRISSSEKKEEEPSANIMDVKEIHDLRGRMYSFDSSV